MNINWQSWLDIVVEGVIRFGGGLLILLLAWIVARILRGITRRLLGRTSLDNRLAQSLGGSSSFQIENMIAQAVYTIVLLFGAIAALTHMQLDTVAGPLQVFLDTIFEYLPRLASAGLLALLAFIIATIIKTVIVRGSDMLNLDKRVNALDAESTQPVAMGTTLGTAGFWLVILMFLPGILDKLGMQSLVAPLQDMLNEFLTFLPNLLGAAIIAAIGWFVARIVRQVVTSLMRAADVDRYARQAGLTLSITDLVGTLVYTVILLLVIVQALNALQIEAISGPATSMIDLIFSALPRIFGAVLVLGISYIIAKLVAGLVESLLQSAGFDGLVNRLGVRLNDDDGRTPSQYAGWIVLVGFMLLATLAATDMLGFGELSNIVNEFVGFAGQVLLGIIVFGIGIFLANFAYDIATDAGLSNFVANLIRAAVMVLVGAMALERMGIGSDIVQLAFGIGLGAIGIAAALAFGLGSRDIAGREVERFVSESRSQSTDGVGD